MLSQFPNLLHISWGARVRNTDQSFRRQRYNEQWSSCHPYEHRPLGGKQEHLICGREPGRHCCQHVNDNWYGMRSRTYYEFVVNFVLYAPATLYFILPTHPVIGPAGEVEVGDLVHQLLLVPVLVLHGHLQDYQGGNIVDVAEILPFVTSMVRFIRPGWISSSSIVRRERSSKWSICPWGGQYWTHLTRP